MDSTSDIPEDPWKLAHTAAAPFFRPPAFKETTCTILLIEKMGVEVTPQIVYTLDSIAAKIPEYNMYIHASHDYSTAPSIQFIVQDFKPDLEFFKSDIPGLLPVDNNNDSEPGPSKHTCFMALDRATDFCACNNHENNPPAILKK